MIEAQKLAILLQTMSGAIIVLDLIGTGPYKSLGTALAKLSNRIGSFKSHRTLHLQFLAQAYREAMIQDDRLPDGVGSDFYGASITSVALECKSDWLKWKRGELEQWQTDYLEGRVSALDLVWTTPKPSALAFLLSWIGAVIALLISLAPFMLLASAFFWSIFMWPFLIFVFLLGVRKSRWLTPMISYYLAVPIIWVLSITLWAANKLGLFVAKNFRKHKIDYIGRIVALVMLLCGGYFEWVGQDA